MIALATDTFITVTDADAYMSARLHAAEWTGAAETDKEAALRMATATLNRERYAGHIAQPTQPTQPLAWPRSGVIDAEGRAVPSDTIPAAIANATAELALFLLRYDLTDDRTRRGVFNVRSEKVGESQMTLGDAGNNDTLPAIVRDMISPYQAVVSSYSARLIP